MENWALSASREIADTGLKLPVFGLGTAHLGELYAPVEEAEAQATLSHAWDLGIRYYDTAPWYGRGLAEHRLGGFLRTRDRREFFLTTKVGRTLHRPQDIESFDTAPWKGGLKFEVRFDYSYDGIMRSYEQALQRLAMPEVDALLIHDLDAEYQGDQFSARQKDLRDSGIKALQELKQSGDIKAYGMGINTGDALENVATQVDLDFVLVAMPYTLLDHTSLDTGMAQCVKRNVSVIIGSPFASGILATGSGGNAKYGYASASPDIQAKVRAMEEVCSAHKVPLQAAALQFPLAHPAVVSIIPGATRSEEVEQNVRSLDLRIPSQFWDDLKEAELIDQNAPVPGPGN